MGDDVVDFGDEFRTSTRSATQLISDIVDTSNEFMARVGKAMGVNATDLSALQMLMMTGPLTPSEIAQSLGMSPAAVTTIVDRLERLGKVTRTPHPTDRRAVIVGATPESVGYALEDIMPVAQAIDAVIDEFDQAEQATITRYLSRVLSVHREKMPD